eukprot:gene14515-17135_t
MTNLEKESDVAPSQPQEQPQQVPQGFAPQQGYAPPPQGYAPPPQGYAPPPQGYTGAPQPGQYPQQQYYAAPPPQGAYPPQQQYYAPPTGAPQPQYMATPPQGYVATGPTIIVAPAAHVHFREVPVDITCGHCQARVTTKTHYVVGGMYVEHSCPNCKTKIHRFDRMNGK